MRTMLALVVALPLAAFATVNVNIAQQSELQRTKGLDKVKAKAIIEYRAQNGTIDTFEELEQAIGRDAVEKVRPQVAFSGPAYTPSKAPEKAEKPRTPAKKPAP